MHEAEKANRVAVLEIRKSMFERLPLTSESAIRRLLIVQACHTVGVRPPLIVIVKLWTRRLAPPAPTCKRGQRSNKSSRGRAGQGRAASEGLGGGDDGAQDAARQPFWDGCG